jgi:DNA-binding transcriptional regulator YbjK
MDESLQKLILAMLKDNQTVTNENSVKLAALLEAKEHEKSAQESHRELTRSLSDRINAIESKINKAAGALVIFSSLVTVSIQYVMSKIKGVS